MDWYIQEALRTESQDFMAIRERLCHTSTIRILHASMGITEAAELVDAVKKHIFYGKPLDKINLAEEAGDMMWYLAILLSELGLSFEEINTTNIFKLRARYPEKFTEHCAENRNLNNERQVLEEIRRREYIENNDE